VRSAFERLMHLYDDDQVVLYGLIEPERAAALRARLKEALATLVDDDKRDAYDVTIGLPPRERPAPLRVVAPAVRPAATVAGSNSSTFSWSGSFSYVVSTPAPAPSAPAAQVLSVAAPVPVPVVAQPAPSFIVEPVAKPALPEVAVEEHRTPAVPSVDASVAAPAELPAPPQPAPVDVQQLVVEQPVTEPAVVQAVALTIVAPAVVAPALVVVARDVEAPVVEAPVVAAPVVAAPVVASEALAMTAEPNHEKPVVPAAVPEIERPEQGAASAQVLAVTEPAVGEPVAPPPELAHARTTHLPAPRPESAAPVVVHPVEPPPVAEAPLPDATPRLGDDVQVAIVPARATPTREFRAEPRRKPFEVPAGVEINGDLLRQVRMARGLTMLQLAERTRISARHLENVEGDRYDALPATVYLRGILMNLARELGLDGLRVSKSYLTFVDAHRSKG
jgi:hypothetical protein